MLHLSKRQEVLLCLFDPVALVPTSVIAQTVFYMLTSLLQALQGHCGRLICTKDPIFYVSLYPLPLIVPSHWS